jgi:hypothetical protein
MKLWMDISGTPEYRGGAAGYARQNPGSGPGSGLGDAQNPGFCCSDRNTVLVSGGYFSRVLLQ